MKKALALILAMVMALALVACGGQDGNETPSGDNSTNGEVIKLRVAVQQN